MKKMSRFWDNAHVAAFPTKRNYFPAYLLKRDSIMALSSASGLLGSWVLGLFGTWALRHFGLLATLALGYLGTELVHLGYWALSSWALGSKLLGTWLKALGRLALGLLGIF
jgi:hypothetical protein